MDLVTIGNTTYDVMIIPAIIGVICLIELLRWLYRKSRTAGKKGHYRELIFNNAGRFHEISFEEMDIKNIYDEAIQKRYIDDLTDEKLDLVFLVKPTLDGGPSSQIFYDNELTTTDIFSYMRFNKNMKFDGFWDRMSLLRTFFNDQLSLLFDDGKFVEEFLKFMEEDMEIPRQCGQQVVKAINLCRLMITQRREIMLVVAESNLFVLCVRDFRPTLIVFSIRYLLSVRASMIKFLVKNDDIVKSKFYDLVNKYIDRTVNIDIKEIEEGAGNKIL